METSPLSPEQKATLVKRIQGLERTAKSLGEKITSSYLKTHYKKRVALQRQLRDVRVRVEELNFTLKEEAQHGS